MRINLLFFSFFLVPLSVPAQENAPLEREEAACTRIIHLQTSQPEATIGGVQRTSGASTTITHRYRNLNKENTNSDDRSFLLGPNESDQVLSFSRTEAHKPIIADNITSYFLSSLLPSVGALAPGLMVARKEKGMFTFRSITWSGMKERGIAFACELEPFSG